MRLKKRMSLKKRIWLWVIRFAYRRIELAGTIPDGIPGIRDSMNRCSGYMPLHSNAKFHHFECYGDGHYLCSDCSNFRPEYER